MALRLFSRPLLSSSNHPRILSTTRTRQFSMSASPKNPWSEPLPKPAEELGVYLALLPDFKEGSKRMDVRPTHLQHAQFGFDQGWIIKAGATFAGDHGENDPPKMTGSWMLIREESMEKALARLSRDVYTTGGAWNMKEATIQAVAVAKH